MVELVEPRGPTHPRFQLNFSGREPVDRTHGILALLSFVPAQDHAVRARLEASLVGAATGPDPALAAAAARRAQAHADAAGDRESRAWALLARCASDLSPASLEVRLGAGRELLDEVRQGVLPELAATAYLFGLSGLVEAGDIAGLDNELGPTSPTLIAYPELADGRHAAWFRCLRATLDGRTKDAEELAATALLAAREATDPDAEAVFAGQIAIVRWMQGRASDVEGTFLLGRQHYPNEPVWSAGLAWVWLYQGRESAARGLVRALPPVPELPRDRSWLATVSILATVVAELGETALVEELRATLLPFADRLATIGLGVTLWGTVARPLALLALAAGDLAAARDHYATAIDVCARVGAHAWLAEAQIELALLLERMPDDPAHDQALRLAEEAATTGRALELDAIEARASAVVAQLRPPARATLTVRRPCPPPKVQVLGGFHVVGADGSVARWQSRKARELLKILVARRGSAVERTTLQHLLWPDLAPAQVANRFSVAATTVRRALDPSRQHPSDAFLDTAGGIVTLHISRLEVDSEQLLTAAKEALADPGSRPTHHRIAELQAILDLYRGEVLVDEADAPWADRLRREVHLAHFATAHELGRLAAEADDQVARVGAYRAILAVDAYDLRAHEELVDALEQLGATHQALEARLALQERLDELGLDAVSH